MLKLFNKYGFKFNSYKTLSLREFLFYFPTNLTRRTYITHATYCIQKRVSGKMIMSLVKNSFTVKYSFNKLNLPIKLQLSCLII